MKKEIVTEFIIGKIVAEDIYNNQRQLLLKAGNRLSSSIVDRLHKEKIVYVWVK
jgi:hypothetical protein